VPDHASSELNSPRISHARVVRLALPMTLAHLSTPLLGIADAAIIGRLGQAHLLGAIAACAVIFDFIFWSFGFLRMGTAGSPRKPLALGFRSGCRVRQQARSRPKLWVRLRALASRGACTAIFLDLKRRLIFDRAKITKMFAINRDIFIRNTALLFAFAFFYAQGARGGDIVLAGNAILHNLVLIGS